MLEIFSSGNEVIFFGKLLGAKSAERAPEWVAGHHVSEKFGAPIDVSRRRKHTSADRLEIETALPRVKVCFQAQNSALARNKSEGM